MADRFFNELNNTRTFFNSGATRSYAFRIQQLKNFKKTLLRYENDIYQALHTDLGKSKEESYATEFGLLLAEINYAIKKLFRWMKPESVRTTLVNLPSSSKIYRDPLGVVFIIAPWNYPLQLLLIPLTGALAGGNCVVLKPSELAPATEEVIKKIIAETFPPYFVQVWSGEGATLVPQLMNAFRFDHVFYTGSTHVGKIIYQLAAQKLIPVTLELGGKSPAIVEADAHLPVAARRIALGKFINAGQTCIAPDYLLVHSSVKEPLINNLVQSIERFYGPPGPGNYEYGKIINEKRFDKLISYLQQGTILYGGHHDRSRLWIAPTIIDRVPLDAPLMTEEIFGPILPVCTFDTTAEALQLVKQNPDPLAFYLFTSDRHKENAWIQQLSFGGGCINNTAWHFANKEFPFGGVGYSGMGVYHGKYSFQTFTREKPVMKTPVWFDPSFKYPPLKGRLNFFKKFIH